MEDVRAFYDDLADVYDDLFADWDEAVGRQAAVIESLASRWLGRGPLDVLDGTCGIGTQAIGLALRGHRVVGCDLSPRAIAVATEHAARLGAVARFAVADVRALPEEHRGRFDLAISFDNALPHLLEPDDLAAALSSMARCLRPGGRLLASIRDYDRIASDRPRGEPPRLLGAPGERRLVVQAWEWDAARPLYRVHQFLVREQGDGRWITRHSETTYRAIQRAEMDAVADAVGLDDRTWIEPGERGFYQPVFSARQPARAGTQAAR